MRLRAAYADAEFHFREKDMRIRKTSTPKKIKANRDNARKSTGPKTAQGKSRSRTNSYKHGYFATAVSISDSEQQALKILRAKIAEESPAATVNQESAIDLIAYCHRRLKAAMQLEMRRLDASLNGPSPEPTATEGEGLPEMLRWYGTSPQQLTAGIRLLDMLAADVQQRGHVPDQWKQAIANSFGQQFLADLAQWSCPIDLETLKLARMMRAHAENFNIPLPKDSAENGETLVAKDPNQSLEMMLKLISVQRQALQSAKRMMEEGLFRSAQSAASEFNSRYFTAAMRDLQRAVEWLQYLKEIDA